MPRIEPGRWQVLSGLLDVALELPAAERDGWVASLRERDRALAEELQSLLAEHAALEREGFLAAVQSEPMLLTLAAAALLRPGDGTSTGQRREPCARTEVRELGALLSLLRGGGQPDPDS